MNAQLQAELDHRASVGQRPVTVEAMQDRLKALGYRLDRTMDCRSQSRWMTGPRAGESYPAVHTGIREIDTGLSFSHIDARRDENFRQLQALRSSGELFAVSRDSLLEL